MNIRQTEEKDQTRITALYERLSCDDDLAGDSNSITNQKRYLQDYAGSHGFTNCVHYTDDGWSGGNFERPAWKQMAADIEAGKISTVIAKDMSRIGREYLQTGYFTEVFFRQHGVRFIAISNGIDSANQSTSEIVPFLNVMNEYYIRDISRKQRAAYQARSKAGIPVTNQAIYGYKKDPNEKHYWIIDEEAAPVVRRIFQMAASGNGTGVIASALRDDHIDRPSVHFAKLSFGIQKNTADMSRPYDWAATSVAQILERQEYLGHTVNFKTWTESYKDKKKKKVPLEDRVLIENTHEAIIDKETWELAQQVRKTVHRTDKTGIASPFTGLLFCADCGEKMYNHRRHLDENKPNGGIDPITGLLPRDHFQCSTYCGTHTWVEKKCFSHYIPSKALRVLVLETIRLTSKYAIENQEEFAQKVREATEIKQNQEAKELKKQISKAQRRSAELDGTIKKLYDSYAAGKISESRFDTLLAEYEKEQAEAKELAANGQTRLDAYEADTDRVDQFMALAKKYTDFTELTPQMVYEFIERIEVHAPVRDDGVRSQEVDIYLKYIGKFDVPTLDTEPGDPDEQERLRKRRQYQREYRRKKKEDQAAAKMDTIEKTA